MNLTWIDYLLPEAKNLWSRKERKRGTNSGRLQHLLDAEMELEATATQSSPSPMLPGTKREYHAFLDEM